MSRNVLALFILSLFGAASASAENTCQYIKRAEAIGIVAPAKYATLVDENWNLTNIDGPVLTYSYQEVQPGETVASLATKSGFLPDKYNIDVVASLNTDIGDLNKIQPGEILYIPSLEATKAPPQPVDGYKYWYDIGNSLNTEATDGTVASQFMLSIDDAAERYGDDPTWKSTSDSLGRIALTLHDRPDQSPTFPMIEQKAAAYQTAGYLTSLMSPDSPSSDTLSATELSYVAQAGAEQVAALGLGRVPLTVKTYSPAYEKLDGLRLYRVSDASYRLNCLEENKIEFDTRSFEAQALIPVARWWIWAEDAQGHKSEPREIAHARGGLQIDLTVEWLP